MKTLTAMALLMALGCDQAATDGLPGQPGQDGKDGAAGVPGPIGEAGSPIWQRGRLYVVEAPLVNVTEPVVYGSRADCEPGHPVISGACLTDVVPAPQGAPYLGQFSSFGVGLGSTDIQQDGWECFFSAAPVFDDAGTLLYTVRIGARAMCLDVDQ